MNDVNAGRLRQSIKQALSQTVAPLLLASLSVGPAYGAQKSVEPAVLRSDVGGDERCTLDVPQQELNASLQKLALVSQRRLLYRAELVDGLVGPALKGEFTVPQALALLLQGTGLEFEITASDVVVIRSPTTRVSGDRNFRLASAQDSAAGAAPANLQTVEEIIVTGSYTTKVITVGKTAQSLRETPQSVTVLTRQRLEDQNLTTLEDAMEQAVGVDTVNITGYTTNFFTRGYQMTVQNNNAPSSAGSVLKMQYDAAIYERIEAWRGPTGLLQGVGEPGGIINLVRKRPEQDFGLDVSLTGGSWNSFHGDVDITGALNKSNSLRGRVVLAARDRDFFYDVAHEERRTIYGVIEADLTPSTTLGLSFTSQDNKGTPPNGLPTASTGKFLRISRSAYVGPEWNSIEYDTNEVAADLTQYFGENWNVKATVTWGEQDNIVQTSGTRASVGPANTTNFAIGNFNWQREALDADLTLNGFVELFGRRHEVLVGYSQNHYDQQFGGGNRTFTNRDLFDRNFERPAIPTQTLDESYEQSAIYGMARIKLLDPVTLIVGGRSSDYKRKQRNLQPVKTAWVKDANQADGEFTPYGGLIWDINGQISLYASYADIFTPQGSFVDFMQQPLDPRVGWQVEAGAKGEFFDGQLNASLSVYRLRDTNRAIQDPDHPADVSSPTTSCCYLGAGLVQSEGWEVEVAGRPLPGWDITAGYSYNDNEFVRHATPAFNGLPFLTYTPAHLVKIWSTYRFNDEIAGGLLSGWNVGLGMNGRSRIYAAPPFQAVTVEQGSVAILSAQLGYRFNEGKTHATMTIGNVTDREYYDTIFNPNFGNYRGEPRSFALTVRHSFF